VEKEVMNERLVAVEAECERLRGQVRDFEKISVTKGAETSVLEARNVELQEALSTALSRLQATDVAAQSSTYRIVDLEKLNVELVGSRDALESQVCWCFDFLIFFGYVEGFRGSLDHKNGDGDATCDS